MRRSMKTGAALILLAILMPIVGQAQTAARKIAMYPPGESGERLLYSSGDIRIAVNNSDGRFTIGTADGKSLLFGYPNEGATSHAHFFVNDTIRGTYIADGGMHPVPAPVILNPVVSSGSIVSTYLVDGVEFTQRLTPTYWGDNPTVLIEYTATNTTTISKRVGSLLFLDTMIGDNDYAPIATEYGYFAIEREFLSPDIPTYWQAFETSPWQPPESLIGGGMLVGGSAVPPDRVVFGDFWSLDDVRWDYTISGDPYSDSAVLFRWDAEYLAPGESRRMATYYGMGSAEITIGDLNLSLSAPDELTIEDCEFRTPNPFPINLIVSNATGTAIGGITAEIEAPGACEIVSGEPVEMITPSALGPAATGTVSWNISIADSLFENDTTLHFSAYVFGTGTDTFHVDWTIDIPGNDGIGPTAELLEPAPGGTTSCDSMELFFRLIDSDGIDESSIRVDVGSTFYVWPNPEHLEFDYPYLRCNVPSEAIDDGLVAIGLGSVTDENGCPIYGTDEWNITVDRQPPEVTLLTPSAGDTILDENFEIVAEISDISGIDTESLEWNIDGHVVSADFDGEFARVRPVELGIAPTGLEDWHICLQNISDGVEGSCGGNEASPVCVDFYTNFTAPRAEIIQPLPGSYNSCDNPIVAAKFRTPGEDIDPATVRFEYDGVVYDLSSPNLVYEDSILTFIAPETPADNSEIPVKLFASTHAGIPITPLNWTFFADRSVPEVSAIYPPDGIFITPDDNISLLLHDNGSGIDPDSTLFDIEYTSGTRELTLSHTALTASGDTLVIDLDELDIDLEHCGYVDIRIDARDLATGCGANELSDFHYRIDVPCSPPNVGEPDIIDETYTSCDTFRIDIPLSDDEGLDLTAMQTRFNGYLIPLGDLAEYESDTLHLTVPRGTYGMDSVYIYISPILDVFGNVAPPLELVYHWDTESPVLGDTEPAGGSTVSELPDHITIEANDAGAGIDPGNCSIRAMGVTITESSGLTYDGSIISVPSAAFDCADEDSVVITAIIADNVTLCDVNTAEHSWVVYFDQGAPIIELISPPHESIVGCENGQYVFTLTDENGVDPSTIELIANGTVYTSSDPELNFSDDTLIFTSPAGLFEHEVTADVQITDVSDMIGNAISFPSGGSFQFDFEHPTVELLSPIDGTLRGPEQVVQWTISDELAGIDPNSIEIQTQGTVYSLEDEALNLNGDNLTFDPVLAEIIWTEDTDIDVIVADNPYNCPNQTEQTHSLTYEPASIEVLSSEPMENQVISCDPLTVALEIETSYGLDIADAMAICDGTTLPSDAITNVDNVVMIEFEESQLEEGTHNLTLSSVKDTLGNTLGEVELQFITDYTAPSIIEYTPATGPVSPRDLEIMIIAQDEIAGLNEVTAEFNIDGEEYSVISPEVDVIGDTIRLDASNMNLMGNVNISFEIDDCAEMCGANTVILEWELQISGDGPEYQLTEPFDGSITHDRHQPIKIVATDSDGIDRETIEVRAGSYIWTFENGLNFSADTLIIQPDNEYESGETYQISVFGDDVLGNPSDETLGAFITDFDPPEVISTSPSDRSSVSDIPEYIEIKFEDDISGIDPNSVALIIDNYEFAWGDPGLSLNNNTLSLDIDVAGLSWKKPDSVRVILQSLADYPGDYGAANEMTDEFAFSFIIMEQGCTALPKPFSPNGDGWYDDVTIYTGEPEPTTIRIYTAEGSFVTEKRAQGKFIWDGKDATGRPMKAGTYVYTVTRIMDKKTLCGGKIILAR